MLWKDILKHLIMNQDIISQPPLFRELIFSKKVNKAMKMLTQQYYGQKFTNLIGTNILKIVFDFITY